MWIKTDRDGTARLYDAEIDVAVSFSDNGTAQVTDDVGAQLIDRYDAIAAHDSDSDSDSEPDTTTDS